MKIPWLTRPKVGSHMIGNGNLVCSCGENIPVKFGVELPTVPQFRLQEQGLTVVFSGVPCSSCSKTYSIQMQAGGPKKQKKEKKVK